MVIQTIYSCEEKTKTNGWEPWSSGYWRRFTIKRLWVQIPAPYAGWVFFTFICFKIVMFARKRLGKTKKNATEGQGSFVKDENYTKRGRKRHIY